MSSQLQTIRSKLRHEGRGVINEFTIQFINELWDRTGVVGYGIGIVVVGFAANFLFGRVFGVTGTAFDDVGAVALLVAFVYTGWIGFTTYEEYTDRKLSRSIRERPSIATVDDAFGLLQSNDDEARVNASYCLSAVISTSPKHVVNTTEAPPAEIVEYLIPYLSDDDQEISQNIGNVVAFMARDYHESVTPFRDELLELVTAGSLSDDVRGNLALAIGFLTLEDIDTDGLEGVALELSEDGDPDVRFGACFMLAGIGSRKTRNRLEEMAQSDPEEEVREIAGEMV